MAAETVAAGGGIPGEDDHLEVPGTLQLQVEGVVEAKERRLAGQQSRASPVGRIHLQDAENLPGFGPWWLQVPHTVEVDAHQPRDVLPAPWWHLPAAVGAESAHIQPIFPILRFSTHPGFSRQLRGVAVTQVAAFASHFGSRQPRPGSHAAV